ncbi:hypothetical protein ABTG06_19265, partial [Acinetobacter baumannii]
DVDDGSDLPSAQIRARAAVFHRPPVKSRAMSKKSAAVRSRTHAAAASAPSGASAVVSAAPAGVPPLALGVALSILIHAFVLAINFAP